MWPPLEVSPYVSLELGLAFLAPGPSAIRESATECTFELPEGELSVKLLEPNVGPEEWLQKREYYNRIRRAEPYERDEEGHFTWYWLESEPRDDLTTKNTIFCRFSHSNQYLVEVSMTGHSVFVSQCQPAVGRILASVGELVEPPWRRYKDAIIAIAAMVREEFAGKPVEYATAEIDYGETGERLASEFRINKRYGGKLVCKVLPASSVTPGKLWNMQFTDDMHTDLRVYSPEPFWEDAKNVLMNMKKHCDLLMYIFDASGRVKIVRRETI